jgi:hypothetical protein
MDDLRRRDPRLLAQFSPALQEGVEGYTRWFVENGPSLIGEPRLIEPVANRLARRGQGEAFSEPIED